MLFEGSKNILFRGKRVGYKKWVEGYYVWKAGETTIHTPDGICCTVDSKTVCQYTKLNDKNGNKIWEGDIVISKKCNDVGFIKYDYGKCMIVWKKSAEGKTFELYDWVDEIEVIGNIFDNPKLYRHL